MTWSELATYMKGYGGIDYANSWKAGTPIVPTNNPPEGVLEEVVGGVGRVSIAGWAFDKDDVNKALEIHTYIGSQPIGGLTANTERSDVNKAYGCGDYHGFEGVCWVGNDLAGNQRVDVYAIDNAGDSSK